jgi:hypothetical protein
VLYDPAAHEPLTTNSWSDERGRETIRAIIADAAARLPPDGLWPVHPRDEPEAKLPALTTLWLGAAGVIWARRLGEEVQLDLAAIAERAHAAYLEQPDFGKRVPGLRMGEAGLLLVCECLAPQSDRADRLLQLVRTNSGSETSEIMWGASGTMLAAHAMFDWTDEKRWAQGWRHSAERLWGVAGDVRALAQGGDLLGGREDELRRHDFPPIDIW